MGDDEEGRSRQPGHAGKPPSSGTEFTFVLGKNQEGVHSQAMRAHWRRRRQENSKKERQSQKHRHLLPNAAGSSASNPRTGCNDGRESQPGPSEPPLTSRDEAPTDHTNTSSELSTPSISGIPSQALLGMNRALATSRIDPFDTFPVKLTAQHHKLLHHWLSAHATMMFDDLPLASFNPMRDVWFPLDLSNVASFNAIMAHSAAHLGRMQGIKSPKEALKYKTEAVRIVMEWMRDPESALGDEVFAAVVRLLTYERYWGTEDEWRIHRNGLQRMIEARGGILALQGNWRLELVTFLISLMSKPSWFDSSNQISQIAKQPMADGMHPILGNIENLHRIRCLWLISFVQDLRTFMSCSPELSLLGLTGYPAIQDAVILLKRNMPHGTSDIAQEAACTDQEFGRLACLFFICVLIQRSESTPESSTEQTLPGISPKSGDLTSFDKFLHDTRHAWEWTVDGLHTNLFRNPSDSSEKAQETNYVLNMAYVLGSMSPEARHGVERCLIHIICPSSDMEQGLSFDDDWTPDSLLSSLHGL